LTSDKCHTLTRRKRRRRRRRRCDVCLKWIERRLCVGLKMRKMKKMRKVNNVKRKQF